MEEIMVKEQENSEERGDDDPGSQRNLSILQDSNSTLGAVICQRYGGDDYIVQKSLT